MIRSNFSVDPDHIDEAKFIQLGQEALWLDNIKVERLNIIISNNIVELTKVLFQAQNSLGQ